MKKLSLNKLENLEGGRFLGWGWTDWSCSTAVGIGGLCTTCTRHYSSFWISVKTELTVSCAEY